MKYYVYSSTNPDYDFCDLEDAKAYDSIQEAKDAIAEDVESDFESFRKTLKGSRFDRKAYTTPDEYGQYEWFAVYDILDENRDGVDSIIVNYPSYQAKEYKAMDFQDFVEAVFYQDTETDYDGNIEYYTPDGTDHITYPKEDMEAYCKAKGVEMDDIDASDYEEMSNTELIDLLKELFDQWKSDLD